MHETCASCANLFKTDTSPTGCRCGASYFAQPPLERQIKRLDEYPVTQLRDTCDRWRQEVGVF